MLLARRSVRRSWCPSFAVRIVLASSVLALAASGPVAAQTGAISGTVTDSTTGAPIAGIWVAVSDASRRPVVAYMTADSGSYTVGGLPAGIYYLNTSSSVSSGVAAEYLDEQYNGPYPTPGLLCPMSCTVTSGAPVTVAAGLTTASIDFALELGGRISGVITDSSGATLPVGTGLGSGYGVSVYSTSGVRVGGTRDYGSPAYLTRPLPAGSYYVQSANNVGYVDELYNGAGDGLICEPSCTVTAGTIVQVVVAQTTPTINFALAAGGRISGSVTDSTGTVPLAGVTVSVYGSSGTLLTSAPPTSSAGAYATSLTDVLPDGDYFVKTSNSLGYVDELYNDLPCTPSCTVTTGTPVSIVGGVASPAAVNFVLAQPTRLSGTVRKADGTPLGGVSVQVYSSAGVFVTSATSASSTGIYTTSSLAPGTYYIRTSSSLGYLNQLYSGIPCEPSCTVTTGTPLALGAGTTTLNFSLTMGAKVTGVVSSGGVLLSGVSVDVINAAGTTVKTATTGVSGAYAATGLLTGNYFVRTRNAQGYFDELHDNVPCPSCSVPTSGGTAVSVTAGGLGDAIVGFDLAKGGQITGRVSDAVTAAGIPSVSVQVVDAAGRTLGSSTTTSLGAYATTGLPTGRYFVRASPSSTTAYITAVYDALQCAPCSVTDGLPVEVTVGAITSGINIALETGGRISGTVTGGSPLAPLNVQIDFVDSAGTTVSSAASASSTGVYTSSGLPGGTYFARTRAMGVTASTPAASQGFVNEVYDDVTCSGCNPVTGTPIVVNPGATIPNIDFVLSQGGRVSGHVSAGGQPVQGVQVHLFSQTGLRAVSVTTSAAGEYSTPDGLAAGDYYARTFNSLGYINKLYDVSPPCFPTCTPTSGTAIHVPASGMVGSIDFALQAGGRISGMITDSASSLPLSGISARVYDSLGAQVIVAASTTAGTYVTGAGLPAGTYYVGTSNTAGYINETHPGAPCLGCSPAVTGSSVSVTEGATAGGVDFALEKGGRVAGTVVASAVAPAVEVPLKGVVVEVFTSPYLLPAVTGTTDRLGYYLTGSGLPDGTAYTVRTTNSLGFINERYSDISCIDGCSPEPGGTVAITAPETTASIDFSLDIDSDQDADGIIGSIDTDKARPSDAFSDLPQGGTTAGIVVVRSGWTVSLGDLSAGGVVAELTGAGSGAVTLQTCAAGSVEEVGLDVAGAKANISCAPDTGSTTVRAVAAFPYIELRKTVGGLTTILELAPGQAATIGSPAVADPDNLEPVRIRLVDELGTPVGSFDLDPGESAEAAESASGLLSVTVFSGSVAVTVGEEVVTVGIGQSHGFVLCSPLGIETLIASPPALWPPNHKMVTLTLSPALSGTCGTATCRVVSVTSNEPTNGLGDGDTDPDWEFGEGLTLRLRAERAAGGPGRTYTILIECTDEAGHTVTKTASVSVPHQR